MDARRVEGKLPPCPDAPVENLVPATGAIQTVSRADVLEIINQKLVDRGSKVGTMTEAELTQQMRNNGTLSTDVTLDEELRKLSSSGNFWIESVDDSQPVFPPLNSNERDVVQPFFQEVMKKFVQIATCETKSRRKVFQVATAGKNRGKMMKAVDLIPSTVSCLPDASVHNTPTVGSRKPDINVYFSTLAVKSTYRIVSSWELKPRCATMGRSDFSDDEVGQVIDTNMELLRQQPYREFTLSVLSDGYRFVFFKIYHRGHEQFEVHQSSTFLGMDGWSVAFAFLLQPPAYFGYKHFAVDGVKISRFIGKGSSSFVFEVHIGEEQDQSRVLKLFKNAGPYAKEKANLQILRTAFADSLVFRHLPQVDDNDGSELMAKEVIGNVVYSSIISLPLCEPIRPHRKGLRLERQQLLALYDTLTAVHGSGMINGDIKPSNVLLNGKDAVFCDWGSAISNPTIPVRVGSVGFCDFTLQEEAVIPTTDHDWIALIRTVYSNYTYQYVPTNQAEANAFWVRHFQPNSQWKAAIDSVIEGKLEGVRELFMKL